LHHFNFLSGDYEVERHDPARPELFQLDAVLSGGLARNGFEFGDYLNTAVWVIQASSKSEIVIR
jgi:hypothetical protein